VDLLQIHWPQFFDLPLEDVWRVLLDLQRQGKTRYVGGSNFSVEQLSACAAIGHVDSVQPPLSAINRQAAEAVIPWCAANGAGVIVYSPMESGLLSGAFSVARVAALPDNDVRKTGRSSFSPPNLEANLRVTAALQQVAARRGVSTPAVAVAWTLAWPGVTGAIVGGRRPEQVDDWLSAGSIDLTEEDLTTVADAIAAGGIGQGPAHPRVGAR
jgi:aryl-alcohol dehydrogenase-like predicted oxidoreductase